MVQATSSPYYDARFWQNRRLQRVASPEESLRGESTSSPVESLLSQFVAVSSREWVARASAKLEQLEALQNGFCAEGVRPDDHAVGRAKKILAVLARNNIKPRRIAPIADGGIVFVFRSELTTARIVINNGDDTYYFVGRASAEADLVSTGSGEPAEIVAELSEFLS